MAKSFFEIGIEKHKIEVRIGYRIIQLFSEGLYRSAHKAIEELVSNAFDAGATNVHIVLTPDLESEDATIAVIDDGTGMNDDGLGELWLIGVSNRRKEGAIRPRGRNPIGKFGIGKLATYVLANRLTHISKVGSKYYSTSMDFTKIPGTEDSGIYTDKKVKIPCRELTPKEAREAVRPWIQGSRPGFRALNLLHRDGPKSWTVAIMSDLKSMAGDIKIGRLDWVLRTAMPLRDDFKLFLNGDLILPSKAAGRRIKKWILGKDLAELPKPAPIKDISVSEDVSADKKSNERYGLYHPQLERVTGYAELYEDLLTTGKSADIGRSHGFFVYVRGRLINEDDEYFGLDSNLLRHGTFSRFRMVVNIDKLDEELRSSRESVRQSLLFNIARNMLYAVFNAARSELQVHQASLMPGERLARRVSALPPSLGQWPLLSMIEQNLQGTISPRYTVVPQNLSVTAQKEFLADLQKRFESSAGLLNTRLSHSSQEDVIASYVAATGILEINALHPFVAYFLDDYENQRRNLPLELYAFSEVLTEAYLYQEGLAEAMIRDIMAERDDLLRHLARSVGKRNALMVASDLEAASGAKNALENELVAAFDSMGFDAIPVGGRGKPDGIAEANLAAAGLREPRRYKVSLEAKSKEKPRRKVPAKEVAVSAIARQRDDFNADHAIVVGPDFPTTRGEDSALVKEIKADKLKKGKTITLIRVVDLARLVRLVPLKRLNLVRLRELFQRCITPEECKLWIDIIKGEKPKDQNYREILDTIWQEQKAQQNQPVKYPGLMVALRKDHNLLLEEPDLIERCKALSRMVPEFVIARDIAIELAQRPDKIIEAVKAAIKEYPEDEQPDGVFGKLTKA